MTIIEMLGFMVLGSFLTILFGSLILGLLILFYLKTHKIILPKLMITLIYLFEGFLKAIFNIFGFDTKIIDRFVVEVYNKYFEKEFKNSKKRILFLPQCLRHPECKAPATPYGIECLNCGKCVIPKIKEFAEKKGYKVVIVTGGTMVKRIMKKEKPEGVVGVGCLLEVKEGLEMCHKYGIPAQGVVLLKDGCINTEVSLEELFYTLSK
jgi:hypothetical protein